LPRLIAFIADGVASVGAERIDLNDRLAEMRPPLQLGRGKWTGMPRRAINVRPARWWFRCRSPPCDGRGQDHASATDALVPA